MIKKELEENWKRALADYKNLQKRVDEERGQFTTYANETLIRQLLPVLDNLYTMQQHAPDTGLGYIIKDFDQTLKSAGIEEIAVKVGDEFDATKMDAVEASEGTKVTEIYKKGYLLKNKLIRPTSVKVGQETKIEREEE